MKDYIININEAGCGRKTAVMGGSCAAGGLRAAPAVRILALVLAALMMTVAALPAVTLRAEATTAPELYGDAAVLINADTGEILYDKNRMRQMYPASTTKIMTVMLALENLDPDAMITVSADAEAQNGSELGLVAGETISVRDACYATMLLSANDAAWALAEAVSGNVESFAKLMNDKAADLGALSTYFVTPNGLPNDAHVTSPMDMAKFAQEAMKNDTFREIVGTYQYTVAATNMSAARSVTNTNKLLYDLSTVNVYGAERTFKYEGCTGVKTGHTNAAGYCLVASAERNGANLIGVVFHSTEAQIFPDMIKLLDYGFTGYAPKTIVKAGDVVGSAKVKYGSPGSVDVTTEEDVVAMVEADANGNATGNLKGYSYTVNTHEINAPVTKGTVAGTLTLYNGSEELGSFNLVAVEDVEMSAFQSLFKSGSWTKGYILMIGVVVVVSVVGYIAITFHMRRSAKKQREKRRKRRMMKRIEQQKAEARELEAQAAAAAAAAKRAEEEAEKNMATGEAGDMSRINQLGADEMPDFGEETPLPESMRNFGADRVSDLFNRVRAEENADSQLTPGAAGPATPTATNQPATPRPATESQPAPATQPTTPRPATSQPTPGATVSRPAPAASRPTTAAPTGQPTPRPASGLTPNAAGQTRPAPGSQPMPAASRPAPGQTTPRPAMPTTPRPAMPTTPRPATPTTPRPATPTTPRPTTARPATPTTPRPATPTTPRPTTARPATPTTPRPATPTTARPATPTTARPATPTMPRPATPTTPRPATPTTPRPATPTTPRPAAPTTPRPATPTTPRPATPTTPRPATPTTPRPATPTTPRPATPTTARPATPTTPRPATPTTPRPATPTTARPATPTTPRPATPTTPRPATPRPTTPRPATPTTPRPATQTTPRPTRPTGPAGGNNNNNA